MLIGFVLLPLTTALLILIIDCNYWTGGIKKNLLYSFNEKAQGTAEWSSIRNNYD